VEPPVDGGNAEAAAGEDKDTDAEAGEDLDPGEAQEELERAPSVQDRLLNSLPWAVVRAHRLLGDPAMVGTGATSHMRQIYFTVLDRVATERLSKCKIWLGGSTYTTPACDLIPDTELL
jgi:hypothetical protein